MDLNNQLEQAIGLALDFHKGQKDKAGRDYILHPMWVMADVEGIKCKIAAILHDILEDTDCDEDELRHYDIDEEVIEAVKTLTKNKNEKYFDYIERVSKNKIALKVKLSDLRHNMNLNRLNEVTDKDLKRAEKYKKAYEYLSNICEYGE